MASPSALVVINVHPDSADCELVYFPVLLIHGMLAYCTILALYL
jgi:hypothetical protein